MFIKMIMPAAHSSEFWGEMQIVNLIYTYNNQGYSILQSCIIYIHKYSCIIILLQ